MPAAIDGLNHLAISTPDLDRLVAFWAETCRLTFEEEHDSAPFRHGMLAMGASMIHVFELDEQVTGPVPHLPMFRRGRIDHFALNAPDEHALRAVRDRLVAVGASDGQVTSFGSTPFCPEGMLSVHVEDPDGGHSEICCARTAVSFADDELTPFVPPAGTVPATAASAASTTEGRVLADQGAR
jgi:catechol 2,3-dioxygenase-like lactoylglutathione lyase family enzyme